MNPISRLIFCLLMVLPLTAHSALDGEWALSHFIKTTVTIAGKSYSTAGFDEGTVTFAAPVSNKGSLEIENSLGVIDGSYKQKVATDKRLDAPKISFKAVLNKPQLVKAIQPIFVADFPANVQLDDFKVTNAAFEGEELQDNGDETTKVLLGKQKLVLSFTVKPLSGKKANATVSYEVFLVAYKKPIETSQPTRTPAASLAMQNLPDAKAAFGNVAKMIAKLYQ